MSKYKFYLSDGTNTTDITDFVVDVSDLEMKIESDRVGVCGAMGYDTVNLTLICEDSIINHINTAISGSNKLTCRIKDQKDNNKIIFEGTLDVTDVDFDIIANSTVAKKTKINVKAIDRLRAVELFGNPLMRERKTWKEHFGNIIHLNMGASIDDYNVVTEKDADILLISFPATNVGDYPAGMLEPVLKPGEIVLLEDGNAFFCLYSKVITVEYYNPDDGTLEYAIDTTICKGIFNTSIWDKVNRDNIVQGWGAGYVLQKGIYNEDCYTYCTINYDGTIVTKVDKIDLAKILKGYIKKHWTNANYSISVNPFLIPIDYWVETIGNSFMGKSNYEIFQFLLDTLNCYAYFNNDTLYIVNKSEIANRATKQLNLDTIKSLRYKYFWDKIADEAQVTVTAKITEHTGRIIDNFNYFSVNCVFFKTDTPQIKYKVTQIKDGWAHFVALDGQINLSVNSWVNVETPDGAKFSTLITAYEYLGTNDTMYKTTGVVQNIPGQKAKNTISIERLADDNVNYTRTSLDTFANEKALELFNFYGKRHDSYEMTIIKKNEEIFDYSLLDNVIIDGRKFFITKINYNIFDETARLQLVSVDGYAYNPNVATIPNVNKNK